MGAWATRGGALIASSEQAQSYVRDPHMPWQTALWNLASTYVLEFLPPSWQVSRSPTVSAFVSVDRCVLRCGLPNTRLGPGWKASMAYNSDL